MFLIYNKRGGIMFSDKLKTFRKKQDITQEELAKAIYVSRSLIAKYETGLAYPSKDNLEKLALFFNVDIKDLIDSSETTLEFAHSKNIAEKLNFICLIIVSAISFFISIFVFIPAFQGTRYSYPVESGEIPKLEHFVASIFTGTYNYGNYIGLVLFIFSIFTFATVIISIIYKHKKNSAFLYLASYLLFVIDIFLFFISAVICFSYIS